MRRRRLDYFPDHVQGRPEVSGLTDYWVDFVEAEWDDGVRESTFYRENCSSRCVSSMPMNVWWIELAVLAVSVSSRLHAIDDTMRHQLVIDIGPGKLVSASVCLVRSCELVRPSDRSEAEVTDSADSRMESTMDGCVSLLLLGHICNNIVRRRLYNVTVQPSPRWHHQKTTQPAT